MIEAGPDRMPEMRLGRTFGGRGCLALEVHNGLKKPRRAHTSRPAREFTGKSRHPAVLRRIARTCRNVRAHINDKTLSAGLIMISSCIRVLGIRRQIATEV